MGATTQTNGTNFAIFSRHATNVWLLLFDQLDDNQPSHQFELDPILNRTGDIWHIYLPTVQHGQYYLYQVDGPYLPEQGHRFNRHKPIIDPYAKAIDGHAEWEFGSAAGYDPHNAQADLSMSKITDYKSTPKCVVYGDDGFDWEGDRPLHRPMSETIIYETHVRSLTCHPQANVEHPGSYRGVAEMVPYFKELGVTAIELLPIHAFNEFEFNRHNPETGERLRNYWGYNTLGFFAPHEAYSHQPSRGGAVREFKEMVKAFHEAGVEVILDVVFNHTVEGNHLGPTFSFRGLDNQIFYILESYPRYYSNFSGTGNTFNANHPVVQDFIIDCLRYWVQEMHVDGFRFDLATALCRDGRGQIPAEPPLVIRIAEDPFLRATKIIAEPWDIGGYQVGYFPGGRWAEWNDKYRDQLRQFWRGDHGLSSALATRLAGSSDLYGHGRTPNNSINFIAAHDGFTLNDLVSYNGKHNEANGENNADGHNHNISYNYGVEGPTTEPDIEAIRLKQVKNFLATLLLSQGTPMLNGGDEFRRTQHGNNNAYCQHNEISWYDWSLLDEQADTFRFTQCLIALRKAYPVFRREIFFTGLDDDIRWYTPTGAKADWYSHPKEVMCLLSGQRDKTGNHKDTVDTLLMFNAHAEPAIYYIPPCPTAERVWYLALDTALDAPHDIQQPGKEIEVEEPCFYYLDARSVAVLVSKKAGDGSQQLRLSPHKQVVAKRRRRMKSLEMHVSGLIQKLNPKRRKK